MQQWVAILATAIGATIGFGSAFMNDRFRWKRERVRDRLVSRRELYAVYVATLTEIHEAMRAVCLNESLSQQERSSAIYEAFRLGGSYRLRYQIGITADQQVLDAAELAFQNMRDIRDSLAANGGNLEDKGYTSLRRAWGLQVRNMQRVMREELGESSVQMRGGS